MFLYAVVTIIVSYYAVTIWLPNIYQFIRVRTERAVILESVKKEVANDVFDVKDLAVAITKKVEDAKAPRVHKINPRFHLKQNTIQAARIMSSKPKQKEESIKELKNLSIPNLKLGSSSTVSFNRTTANWEADSRSSPGMVLTPANSSKPHVLTLPIEITAQRSLPGRTYLGTFAPDSIEAKLHQARQPQPQPPAVSEAEMAQLSSERDLREQQDQEYRESLRRDEAVVRKSDAEQVCQWVGKILFESLYSP